MKMRILTLIFVFSIIIVFAVSAHATLVSYWGLNDGTGSTIADDFADNNDGDLVNFNVSTDWVTGHTGEAGDYALNYGVGDNDYVICPNDGSLQITDKLTISAWINSSNYTYDGSKNYQRIVDRFEWRAEPEGYFGYAMLQENNSAHNKSFIHVQAYNVTGSALSATLLPLDEGEWNHVVYVFDQGAVRGYVNNSYQDKTWDFPSSLGVSDENLFIGIGGATGLQPFEGKIGEVAIWNSALDVFEVDAVSDVGVMSFEYITAGINETFDLDALEGYGTGDINQITGIYADQAGTFMGSGNILWEYIVEVPNGHGLGDAWQDGDNYYIQLEANSDGLKGTSVPEPASLLFALAGLGLAWRRKQGR